ncbi:hypothetical protein [Streptomyces sp. A 4/2]|uniref:hypothetical protein n=1 Tax=Streptomyces sp. A 4/2 TaxID=2934314 RepID=UPI0020244F41|nr:hypothetical protein [Streptomyces sp. A 4/2]
MSHMARGILVELLSRPDGWETTADDMWRESVKRHGKASPGRRVFRAAYAELKDHGYLVSEHASLGTGRHGTVLTVRDVSAGGADVPHGGTSDPPAETGNAAGQPDVPACGTSSSPAETGETAGGPDVPHAGTSYRKRSPKKTGEEKKTGLADAEGQSAGGFASAGATDSAAGESDQAGGGSAASAPTKTKRRQQSPGFNAVRAAIPPEVARPGKALFPGLHRAIEDLLSGAPGTPARTPEQVIVRINRRWYGENADERSAADYRGCDRCTTSGCEAARHGPESPDGCKRIKNRNGWLTAAILAQDCPDPSCEDGWIIGGDRCQVCEKRAEEHRAAERAAAEAAARWEAETKAKEAASAADDDAEAAWTRAEAAEEHRVRQALAGVGMYGVLLDHRVHERMAAWCYQHPKPSGSRASAAPQAPVQGAFLLSVPGAPSAPTKATQEASTTRLKAVSNG